MPVCELAQLSLEEQRAMIAFVRDMIAEHRARKERWEKMRQSIIGYVIFHGIIGLGVLVYNVGHFAFRAWLGDSHTGQ